MWRVMGNIRIFRSVEMSLHQILVPLDIQLFQIEGQNLQILQETLTRMVMILTSSTWGRNKGKRMVLGNI